MPFAREWLDRFSLLADTGIVSEGSPPGHQEGWGVAGIAAGAPRVFGRSPDSILTDPAEAESAWRAIDCERSEPVIAHLRKASPGLAVSLANTHPFQIGDALFCHNGSIRHPDVFPVANARVIHGSTDSERWFAFLMERAAGRPLDRFGESLADAIRDSRPLSEASSWTFLLARGSRLYAYREACEQGYGPDDEPGVECLRTHTLNLAAGRGVTLCCSEPLTLGTPGLGPWVPMDNRELVVLEHGAILTRSMV